MQPIEPPGPVTYFTASTVTKFECCSETDTQSRLHCFQATEDWHNGNTTPIRNREEWTPSRHAHSHLATPELEYFSSLSREEKLRLLDLLGDDDKLAVFEKLGDRQKVDLFDRQMEDEEHRRRMLVHSSQPLG